MKNQFIERYQGKYDICHDDDYEDRLVVSDTIIIQLSDECLYTEEFLPDEDSCLNDCTCHIYVQYCFEDDGNIIEQRDMSHEQLLLISYLNKNLSEHPQINSDDGMGCPFVEDEVGYFDIPIDFEKIDKILSAFVSFQSDRPSVIDVDYISKYHKGIYDVYLNYLGEVNFSWYYLFDGEPRNAVDFLPEFLTSSDEVFINKDSTLIAGFENSAMDRVINSFFNPNSDLLSPENINSFVVGTEYCFANSGKHKISIENEKFRRIQFFLKRLNLDEIHLDECKINCRYMLFINYEKNFWAIIPAISSDQESLLLRERNIIKNLYAQIQNILPQHLSINDYDYNKLTAEQFEDMCRDLLDDMGYINIKQRGKINAADGGVDIEADLLFNSPMGSRIEHWIFQCKHTKSQIDRKDLGEVRELMREFHAHKYGLFYSGSFSQQTLARLKNLDAEYWGQGELNIKLRKHRGTAMRYFGI